jgi:hypothetical protein
MDDDTILKVIYDDGHAPDDFRFNGGRHRKRNLKHVSEKNSLEINRLEKLRFTPL